MAQIFQWSGIILDMYLTYKAMQLTVWAYQGQLPPKLRRIPSLEVEVPALTINPLAPKLETPSFEEIMMWEPPYFKDNYENTSETFPVNMYSKVFMSELRDHQLVVSSTLPPPDRVKIPEDAKAFRFIGKETTQINVDNGPRGQDVLTLPLWDAVQFQIPFSKSGIIHY